MFNQKTKIPLPPGSQLELNKEPGGETNWGRENESKELKEKRQNREGAVEGQKAEERKGKDGWMEFVIQRGNQTGR